MNPFTPKATTNEAGNLFVWKVAGLPLELIFRQWSHELFLVFSWNSVQVLRDETCIGGSEVPLLGGDICHKYDASVKSGVQICACISSFFFSSVTM